MARFLAYGSSATYGLYGGEKGGWADRLKTTIAERDITRKGTRGRVFNLACGALTLPKIVEYLPSDIERYKAGCRMVGIFMVGNAEAAIIGEEATEPAVSLDSFRSSLEKATAVCDNENVRQLFVGLSPVDDENPIHPGVRTDANLNRAYDEVLSLHAKSSGAAYVSIHQRIEALGMELPTFLPNDGQHPSPQGHGLIYDLVLEELDAMLPKSRA